MSSPHWGDDKLRTFAQVLGVEPAVAAVLVGRAMESEAQAKSRFSAPLSTLRSPEGMAGFEAAIEILLHAVENKKTIGIFGDYDVDGVSSTALITSYLRALGAVVIPTVATRQGGYGFSRARAEALVEAGAQVVVTVDCGTSDHEALQWLSARGIASIVIDHHQVPKEPVSAAACLNPHQPECGFSFKGMCSGGVGFYVCAGLRRKIEAKRAQPVLDPRTLLDLVAMATVCDMMPLRDNNRVLVAQGLSRLSRRERPGIAALLRIAGVPPGVGLNEGHLGYVIGPRLNAPGRLASAQPALELLLAQDAATARQWAQVVEEQNERRREHQKRIQREAELMLEELSAPGGELPPALVLFSPDWLPGVVGVAAAGLAGRFGRPAAVLGQDPQSGELRGSVRSGGDTDVFAALSRCDPSLQRFGGHKKAAGFSMDRQALSEFRHLFCEAVAEQGIDRRDELDYDGELCPSAVHATLLDELYRVGPFGVEFPEPCFLAREQRLLDTRIVGGQNLAFRLATGDGRRLRGIYFGSGGDRWWEGREVDCLFAPSYNDFRGRREVQLQIKEMWPSRC